jgi:hypothetical protein
VSGGDRALPDASVLGYDGIPVTDCMTTTSPEYRRRATPEAR